MIVNLIVNCAVPGCSTYGKSWSLRLLLDIGLLIVSPKLRNHALVVTAFLVRP